MSLRLIKLGVEFGQRNKHGFRNVPPLPNELVKVPYIEHKW